MGGGRSASQSSETPVLRLEGTEVARPMACTRPIPSRWATRERRARSAGFRTLRERPAYRLQCFCCRSCSRSVPPTASRWLVSERKPHRAEDAFGAPDDGEEQQRKVELPPGILTLEDGQARSDVDP